jgi:predicted dehydrogenase
LSAPRVGLIGARRVRQGLGPFVARDLEAAGARVPCFLAARPESCEPGESELRERAGIRARGYARLDAMLAHEALDALAILSPSATHERYLEAAADAGLHALCEKPLVWGGSGLAERARARVEAFGSRGLLLAENCQWPYTLDAFRALHPGSLEQPPERFAMRLSPVSRGQELLGDCLPHPLSVLQALLPGPGPEVADVHFSELAPARSGLRVELEYRAGNTRLQVQVDLRPSEELPRPAHLEIDGRRAERRIRLPDYAITFVDASRRVPVADPLASLVHDFVAELQRVRGGASPPDPAPIVRRMELLEQIVLAYRAWVDGPDSPAA